MGIDVNGLRFLLYAKSFGVDLTRTAMIGRQRLFPSVKELRNIMVSEFNCDADAKMLEQIREGDYSEKLLRYLGAHEVHSFDASDFEGATYIHDFNAAISDAYFGQYTVLIDGGSLEHVFNFPIAIKNCMQMLKVGGHYLGISPTNNYMGHGFYQFSPELYYRVFCKENGFRVEQMITVHERGKKWLRVANPEDVKSRVGFTNDTPTLLLMLATKQADLPIFTTPPQQSDYASRWKKGNTRVGVDGKLSHRPTWKRWIRKLVKARKTRIRIVIGRSRNRAFFKFFTPFDVKAACKKAVHRTAQKCRR